MNRSHLLPATLLALAAVAIAQSTQNQSNIARLVNVINQVTAKVDGVIPLRDHVNAVLISDDGLDWTVPDGFRAQIVGSSGASTSGNASAVSVWADFANGESFFLKTMFGPNLWDYPSASVGGVVLEPGTRLWVTDNSDSFSGKVFLTLALEEI